MDLLLEKSLELALMPQEKVLADLILTDLCLLVDKTHAVQAAANLEEKN
jgi:hypothetical protein